MFRSRSTQTSAPVSSRNSTFSSSSGHRRFRLVNQALIEERQSRTRQGGAYADHNPGRQSAVGDLPGRWLTKAQAIRKYALLFLR